MRFFPGPKSRIRQEPPVFNEPVGPDNVKEYFVYHVFQDSANSL